MKRTRPKELSDFDRKPGLSHLVQRASTAEQSVWTQSWWVNVACLLIAAGLAGAVAVPFLLSENPWADLRALPTWKMALATLGGVMAALIILSLLSSGINRCRFVIDGDRGELRITYGLWFWRRYALRFADIRSVRSRMLDNDTPFDEGPTVSHRAVFAELRSGELVLLAIDADFRRASLLREIEQALAANPCRTISGERQRLLLT